MSVIWNTRRCKRQTEISAHVRLVQYQCMIINVFLLATLMLSNGSSMQTTLTSNFPATVSRANDIVALRLNANFLNKCDILCTPARSIKSLELLRHAKIWRLRQFDNYSSFNKNSPKCWLWVGSFCVERNRCCNYKLCQVSNWHKVLMLLNSLILNNGQSIANF